MSEILRSASRIAVIGGGTGTSTLLHELKELTPNIDAIINMSDDGGSSGALRKAHGVMPPGDIRQCIIALSNEPELASLMNTRLPNGHPPGNLVLSEMEQMTGSFTAGVRFLSRLLSITGTVHPVTHDNHILAMTDGVETIRGESEIGHRINREARPVVWLEPPVPINPEASNAIMQADAVIIAPGNLFGSILPTLAVRGMKETLAATGAQLILAANITNQAGQTDSWHVADYITTIEEYVGHGCIDSVVYNTGHHSENNVHIDEVGFTNVTARRIGASLVAKTLPKPSSNDLLSRKPRSSVRHNAAATAALIMKSL